MPTTASLVLLFCFVSGCKWQDDIISAIQGSKGKRSVQFIVMTPVKFIEGKSSKLEAVAFDDARARQVRNAVMEGVKSAGQQYTPVYYDSDKRHYDFYNGIARDCSISDSGEKSKAIKKFCAEWIRMTTAVQGFSKCEAIIFGICTAKGENALAEPYTLYLYDIMLDSFVVVARPIPFADVFKFKECLGEAARDLVQKAYKGS